MRSAAELIKKSNQRVWCDILQVLKEITVSSYTELVPNDFSAGIIGPDDYKCMGIIYGKKCLPDQDRWLATFSRIAKNLWRLERL